MGVALLKNGAPGPQNQDAPGMRNFHRRDEKTFVSPRMFSFILSRIAQLERQLEGGGSRIRKEVRETISSFLDSGKGRRVECSSEKVDWKVGYLYCRILPSDNLELREKNIGGIADFSVLCTRKDLEFLLGMKEKYLQGFPVSAIEQKHLLMIKECGMASRFFELVW